MQKAVRILTTVALLIAGPGLFLWSAGADNTKPPAKSVTFTRDLASILLTDPVLLQAPDSHSERNQIDADGLLRQLGPQKYNPDPRQAVRWGDPTYDEMLMGLFEYTIDNQSLGSASANKSSGASQK